MPCGSGGIYVRTDKIIDWIEETTGRTIAKDDCGLDPATSDADSAEMGGGCSATHGGAGLGLALGLLALRRRKR